MKKLFVLSIWMFIIQNSFAQTIVIPAGRDTLQFLLEMLANSSKNVEEIQKKQKQILTENANFKYKDWYRDSVEYENAYNTASIATNKSDEISNTISFLNTCIIEDFAFLAVAKSQNITNSDFPKIMAEEAVKMLGTDKSPEKDTMRVRIWKDVVTRLASNPLLKSVLNSNPVTSTVVSVVNLASSWFNQRIAGTKVENAKINLEQAISQQKMKGFVDRMQVYINFYDELNNVTNEFEANLSNIQLKYKTLKDEIVPYDSQIRSALKLKHKDDPVDPALNALFKIKEIPRFNAEGHQDFFRKVLDDERTKSFMVLALKWEPYRTKANTFEQEFRTALVYFFTRYYDVLNVKSMKTGTMQPLAILDVEGLDKINAALLKAIEINKIRLDEIKGN